MTHRLWGQSLHRSRNCVPRPGGGGGWGFWVCTYHYTVIWGGGPAAVPSLPFVLGAVARHEALHVLLGTLLQAFHCSSPVLSHNWAPLL